MEARLDVLRAMDGFDRLGPIGVFERLTTGRRDASGAWVAGCGITSAQAVVLLGVLVGPTVNDRLAMMARLEEKVIGPAGYTAWDAVLDMQANDDETWARGGRPRNIGFALDDLIELAKGAAG